MVRVIEGCATEHRLTSKMDRLIEAAREVRERAHAPYSGFKVGAAIEDENGRIFTGCNVENATYGLSVCAERVAVLKAISEGAAKLKRVAVVADTDPLTPPCGACRQILWEFCGDVEIDDGKSCGQTGNRVDETDLSESVRCLISLAACFCSHS